MAEFDAVVWQSAFLGDLVLASNLLLNLHLAHPSWKIALVARPFAKELFSNLSWLEVVPLEKTIRGTLRVVGKIEGTPLGFGVQRGLRTSLALFLARVDERVGFETAELAFLYTKRVPHRWGVHEVERNQLLLKGSGIKPQTDELFLSPPEVENPVKPFGLDEKSYAVVSPSANFEPKRWDERHFARVVEFLLSKGLPVVLTGTAADRDICERVKSLASGKGVINLAGKTSVSGLVRLIRGAALLVANDSAPVHIAEAVNTPAVMVYCATSSAYGFYPRRGFFLEPENLSCHPCKPNPKSCPLKNPLCRRAVPPRAVIDLIEQKGLV